MIRNATMLKKKMLTIPNARNAVSVDLSAWGVIKTIQTHTPAAQDKLKSSELFRRTKRMMSGILKRGSAIADNVPIVCIQDSILHVSPTNYNTQQFQSVT